MGSDPSQQVPAAHGAQVLSPETDRRFALETAGDGTGTCARVEPRRADLALDVSTLASLYLGHETAARLHAAGQIEELTPGATHRADSVFRTPLGPWCPDGF
ncbi:sterol carrier protein domain-containing protein [Streptomyces sp. NPDC056549]|uniref:sterol carrier protein domain-containing protein n=1 Tax=Streptomyces sp. NPDC056549 TaxID=3345864 RepID=UPI00367FD90B